MRTKFTQGYINQLENGKKWASLESLEKVSKALKIPLASLFVKENENPSVKIVSSVDKKILNKDLFIKYIILKPEIPIHWCSKKFNKKEIYELLNQLPKEGKRGQISA